LRCQEIKNPQEKALAWFFMLFGDWDKSDTPAEVDNGELISFGFECTPSEPSNPDQEFEIIGSLSRMISMQYNALTAPEGTIALLSPQGRPDQLGVLIPRDYDYERATLRLWKICFKPNFATTEIVESTEP
jgi:hypothetical protein